MQSRGDDASHTQFWGSLLSAQQVARRCTLWPCAAGDLVVLIGERGAAGEGNGAQPAANGAEQEGAKAAVATS